MPTDAEPRPNPTVVAGGVIAIIGSLVGISLGLWDMFVEQDGDEWDTFLFSVLPGVVFFILGVIVYRRGKRGQAPFGTSGQ